MIDFRYHIVSLISVFLALAVGIALGAGPLKETIGDTLTGQVQALRDEKEGLRTQLDETGGDLAAEEAFVSASGERLLAGTLTDRRVALVLIGEVPEEQVTALTERFGQAGATVSATATVNDTWTDPALATYRRTLAGTLVSYLDEPPASDAGTDTELAEALVAGLVGGDSASPDALSENASSLLDVLAEGDQALVTFAEDVTQPADAVVLVAGAAPEATGPSATAEETPDDLGPQLALVAAAERLAQGVVVAGAAPSDDALVAAVRGDDELADATTVSDTTTVSGQVTVPLALAADIGQQPGHYGYGDDLTVLPPAVQLPPVDRSPALPDAGGGAGDVPDSTQDAGDTTSGGEG
ncbi:copper transporter [Cellulomonas dongxiuzhuiae]|uniref:Copper transporter n=1 Tax=Cellulomonas dongxiuzhuiae TaxID=2819979 RepID=A0ABX8GNM0_9CELL|nr:copper transporter [Cellulomonas dongxiuzhuiae]MBO3093217.1 copper transporter [Cellulomonas dongxiuzhuiae]QWC17507.1 copper transporter [Cellulomonas dongxiuzhuiae]